MKDSLISAGHWLAMKDATLLLIIRALAQAAASQLMAHDDAPRHSKRKGLLWLQWRLCILF